MEAIRLNKLNGKKPLRFSKFEFVWDVEFRISAFAIKVTIGTLSASNIVTRPYDTQENLPPDVRF